MTQKPMLNLGCGRLIFPTLEKPGHHGLVDDAIYQYPYWLNVDRNDAPGVDKRFNLFEYPWPLESDAYDGALLSHIAEHIPHEIRISERDGYTIPAYEVRGDGNTGYHFSTAPVREKTERAKQLEQCQDGWYAFFAELYRVLTNGAIVHVLSPYAWSAGAVTDPTHTRLLTEHTFTHSMAPDANSPFAYETGGIHFEMLSWTPHWTELAGPYLHNPDMARVAMQTQINMIYEQYVKLQVVK